MQGGMSLPWDDVRLFLAVYRARTLGEAAGALGVDVSTVSRRLSGLESALDSVLFERGREGLRASPAADALLSAAEQVELHVAAFARATEQLERDVSGWVRVACPPDVAEVVVLPALRALARRHPALKLQLEPGEDTVDLRRREADIALRIVRPTRGDLVVKKVMTVGWAPAASGALIRRLRKTPPASWPWIGWGERFREAPHAAFVERQSEGAPCLRSDRFDIHVAAARAGVGVALLPLPTLLHHRLTELSLPSEAEATPSDTLFLVTPRALRSVPRVRAVWDALDATLGEIAAATAPRT